LWFDPRTEEIDPLILSLPTDFSLVRVSPNGRYALLRRLDPTTRQTDVLLADLLQSGTTSILTSAAPPGLVGFAFSADGRRAVIGTAWSAGQPLQLLDLEQGGKLGEYGRPVRGTLVDWNSEKELAVFSLQHAETGFDVIVQPADGSAEGEALVRSRANDWAGRISPDGRMILFYSDRGGRRELYATTFPAAGVEWQLTRGGVGCQGHSWSADGGTIYYVDAANRLMSIAVERGEGIRFGDPREFLTLAGGVMDAQAVGDGRLLVIASSTTQTEASRADIRLVINWPALLRSKQ